MRINYIMIIFLLGLQ